MVAVVGTALAAIGGGSAIAGGAIVAGGALAIGGTVKSVKSAKASAGAARAAANEQIRANKLTASRQRRQSIRAFLSQRASLAAASRASGIQTSAESGGLGSMSSQFGANLGFSGQMTGINNNITRLSGIQSTQAALSGMYGNIAGLGMQMFNSSGAIGAVGTGIQSIFNPTPPNMMGTRGAAGYTDRFGVGVG